MYNYNPYNQFAQPYNPYSPNNIQQMEQIRDQWDAKIQLAQQQNQIQQQQTQTPQIPQINQSFQLAPTTNTNSEVEARYAESIEEVKNTFVMKTGIFITKDSSTLWIKNVSGDIKTFKLEEIKQLDEKDIQIQQLQDELNNMKILMSNAIQRTEQATQISIEETKKATTKNAKK